MDNGLVRVLLIEDDEDDYLLTRHLLDKIESPRFEITWENTFDDGLAAAVRSEHDVVLVDYRLGARTGVEFAREAVAQGCRSPIIMLTGQSDHEMDMAAMEAGAADYLEKDGLSTRLLERSIRYAIERRQAEAALARERNLLRTLIDNLPDFIYVKDAESRFVLNNAAHARSMGKTPGELVGAWDFDYFPEDMASQFYADEQRTVHTGQPLIQHEERSLGEDGSPIWASTTKVPLRDSDGKIIGIVGVTRDITERKQAEEALRESEERFRSTFEQLTVGIAHTALSGHWLRVNQKLCDILGYTADELREHTWQEMTHPDDLEADVSQAGQAVAGERESYAMEKRFIRKDGTAVWTHMTASLVRDRMGKAQYGVAVIADISARKQIEAALRESEARFRAMNESSPLGIFLTNPDGECVYTNIQYQTLTGLSFEEALGNGWSTAIHLEDRDRVFNEWYQAAEQQALYESVHRYRRKDGRIVWASVKASAARDGDTLLGYVGTVEDVTRRREAEEALRESEARLRTVVSSVPIILFVIDREGRYTFSVGQGLEAIGVQPGERIGQLLYDVYAHRPDVIEHFQRALNGEPQVYEMTLAPDKTYEIRLAPLNEPGGQVTAVIGVAIDITERKRAEQQQMELELQRAQVDVLKRFIGDASHDLRTPLTIMNSSLYLLRKSTDPEKQKRHLDNLDEQVAHIQKLVEDLFTLSRLDMPDSELVLQPYDLNVMAKDVYEQQLPLAAKHNHQMAIVLGYDLPQVLLAPAEITVALRHLVVNALHYTPDGGQITLTTRSEEGRVVFEVRDNGVGIGADDLPFIFERFYRADKARNIETGGSGLGLTITKKIIEVHGGRVEVESTPGVGSVFRVLLPVNN